MLPWNNVSKGKALSPLLHGSGGKRINDIKGENLQQMY
jgi:hypothetical protein